MESAKIYRLPRNRFDGSAAPRPPAKPKLLDQVRRAIRSRHYSYPTEKAYVHWIKRYIFFHNKRHPQEMGEAEIAIFLSSLASDDHVSASTQNQALNAILFLYNEVLEKRIGLVQGVVRAKRPRHLPVVLSKDEIKKILGYLSGTPWLMATILYGAGLRLMECCVYELKISIFHGTKLLFEAVRAAKTVTPCFRLRLRNRCYGIFRTSNGNMKAICKLALAESLCLMHFHENIPMRPESGDGNGHFQRRATTLMR